MRAWEFLTESFDQPYPVKLEKEVSDTKTDYRAEVPLPDGTDLVIDFGIFDEEDGNPWWTMSFDRDGNSNITGEGDAMKIFATVIEAIRQFISQEKPWKFGFAAYKPQRSRRSFTNRNTSRSKLYARMIKRFAGQMGYQVDIKDDTINTDFILTNPSYKKTNADITESFDNPYRYKTSEVLPGQLYEMIFKTDSGDLVVVVIEAWDKARMNWEIEFFRNDEQDVTGEGDAMRIFATVIKIIGDFVKKHSPDSIKFSAHKDEKESPDKRGSREKLYSRMVQRFAAGMGYNVKEQGSRDGTYYTLTKKFGWQKD